MAKQIGKLHASFGLNTTEFSKKLRDMDRSLKKFSRETVSQFKGIGKIAGVVAAGFSALGAAAALAFKSMIKPAMDAVDENAKLARSLDINIETLQTLQHAAPQYGASVEQVSKAMQRLAKFSGDAQRGTMAAERTLNQLGLSAESLRGMKLDDQFKLISQRLSEVSSAQERASIAQEIFGRDAARLMPMLTMGAKGFKSMADEASRFGQVVTEVDAQVIEDANDEMTKLTSVFDGFIKQISVQLAPLIGKVANRFREWILSFGDVNTIAGTVIEYLIAGLGTLIDTIDALYSMFMMLVNGFKYAINGVMSIVATVVSNIHKTVTALANFIKDIISGILDDIGKGLFDVNLGFQEVANKTRKYSQSAAAPIDALASSFSSAAITTRKFARELKETELISPPEIAEFAAVSAEEAAKAGDEVNRLGKHVYDLATGAKSSTPALRQAFQAVSIEAREAAEEAIETREVLGQAIKTLVSEIEDGLDDIKDKPRTFSDDMKDAIMDWSKSFQGQLQNMVKAGKISFSELRKEFLSMMATRIIMSAVVNPLMGGLGIPGFASGGVGSGLALVGERGPELVDLGDRSRVFNNQQTKNIISSNSKTESPNVTITMTNYFAEGVNEAARAEINSAEPRIIRKAVLAVEDSLKRQGRALA